MYLAIGHPALRAAARLRFGLLDQIVGRNLPEVVGTNLGSALGRISLRFRDELEHGRFGHEHPFRGASSNRTNKSHARFYR